MSSAMAFLGLLTPVLGLSPKFYGNGTCCVNSTQYCGTPQPYDSGLPPEFLCNDPNLGIPPSSLNRSNPFYEALFPANWQPTGGKLCAQDWLAEWVDADGNPKYPPEDLKYVKGQDGAVVDRKALFPAGYCVQVVMSGGGANSSDAQIVAANPCVTEWGDMCLFPGMIKPAHHDPPYGLYTYVLKESMSLHYQYLSPWWGLSCWAPIIFFQSPDGLGCGPIMKCVQDGYLEQMDPASLGEKKSEPELEPEPEPTTPTEPAEEPTTTEEPPSFSLVNPLEMGTVDGEGDT